jgi:hypothetical protein
VSAPRFRYIDKAGVEHSLMDAAALRLAIQEGRLVSGSMLYDEQSRRWAPAGEHEANHAAKSLSWGPELIAVEDPVPDLSRQKIAIAAAACGAVALIREAIVTSGPKQDPVGVLAYGIGGAVGSVLLAALFVGWVRRTRAWMHNVIWVFFVLQAVNLVLEPPKPSRLEVAEELQSFQNTSRALLVPDSSAASRLDIRMPDGGAQRNIAVSAPASSRRSPEARTARALRAMNLLLQGWNTALGARAKAHGFNRDALPDGYLGARYLADARTRPDVQDYFQRYSAYLDDAVATGPAVLDSLARASSAEAGLSDADAAVVASGVRRGINRFFGPKAPSVVAAREFIAAALRLHRFLVRVDSRVRYDDEGDQALFEVDSERFEAIRLVGEVQRKSEQVVKLQREAYEKTKANADSMAAQ